MSWFSEIASDLTSKVEDLSSKVQEALPIDKETLQKLTLTTPEMNAERQEIFEEERRKAECKDSLADMFPWETRDPEREILVEECKEAILNLSNSEETFFGPYQMPALPKIEDDDEDKEEEEEEDDDDEEVKPKELRKPSKEALEKLAKLEPLPPLLADFDLDSHVGLIQRLLNEDAKLMEKQSKLSGGGEREKTFWRNYFFHCAFTRYEAGLSIDEIWSDHHPEPLSREASAVLEDNSTTESETITFEPAENESEAAAAAPAADTSVVSEASKPESAPLFEEKQTLAAPGTSTPPSIEGTDYDMIDDVDDGEMDELEAEIARELED